MIDCSTRLEQQRGKRGGQWQYEHEERRTEACLMSAFIVHSSGQLVGRADSVESIVCGSWKSTGPVCRLSGFPPVANEADATAAMHAFVVEPTGLSEQDCFAHVGVLIVSILVRVARQRCSSRSAPDTACLNDLCWKQMPDVWQCAHVEITWATDGSDMTVER